MIATKPGKIKSSLITLQVSEQEFFDFQKFRESVRTATLVYDINNDGRRVMIALNKPQSFEKINEQITALETRACKAEQVADFYKEQNKDLKETVSKLQMKKKQFQIFGFTITKN